MHPTNVANEYTYFYMFACQIPSTLLFAILMLLTRQGLLWGNVIKCEPTRNLWTNACKIRQFRNYAWSVTKLKKLYFTLRLARLGFGFSLCLTNRPSKITYSLMGKVENLLQNLLYVMSKKRKIYEIGEFLPIQTVIY